MGLFSKENEDAKKVVQDAVDFLKTKESYKDLSWTEVKNPQIYDDGRRKSIKFDQLLKEIKSSKSMLPYEHNKIFIQAFRDTAANLARHSILEMKADHIVMCSSTFLAGAKENFVLKGLKESDEKFEKLSKIDIGSCIVIPVDPNHSSNRKPSYSVTCMEDTNLQNDNSAFISSDQLYQCYSNALKNLKGTVALEPFPSCYVKSKDGTEVPQYEDEHLKIMIRAVIDAAEGLDKDSVKGPSASNKLYVTIATEDHKLYERIRLLSKEVKGEASKPK